MIPFDEQILQISGSTPKHHHQISQDESEDESAWKAHIFNGLAVVPTMLIASW